MKIFLSLLFKKLNDNEMLHLKYYNEFMWNGRYADCISVDEILMRMKYVK